MHNCFRRSIVALLFVFCSLGVPDAVGGDEGAARLREIEMRVGGRLGVSAWQGGSEIRIQHRAEERFAMASTFKLLLAAAVLHRVEKGEEQMDRLVSYGQADLLEYAPVAKQHVKEGAMTVEALCAAVIEYSDNTAANLLLATMGGPEGLTAYVRSLGDKVTRFDRKEPELNTAIPGDPRDTTTPDAMLASMRTVLLGEALTAESRAKLDGWLTRNTTGAAMIRAGVPSGWRVGDKTGRGGNASTNDIAIIRPPEGAPILLCVYSTESKAPAEEREAAVAEVARLVLEALGK